MIPSRVEMIRWREYVKVSQSQIASVQPPARIPPSEENTTTLTFWLVSKVLSRVPAVASHSWIWLSYVNDARKRPSDETSSRTICPGKRHLMCGSEKGTAISQRWSLESTDSDTSNRPSGENASEVLRVDRASSFWSRAPVAMSQKRNEAPGDQVATLLQSGKKRSLVLLKEDLYEIVCCEAPVAMSQIQLVTL